MNEQLENKLNRHRYMVRKMDAHSDDVYSNLVKIKCLKWVLSFQFYTLMDLK